MFTRRRQELKHSYRSHRTRRFKIDVFRFDECDVEADKRRDVMPSENGIHQRRSSLSALQHDAQVSFPGEVADPLRVPRHLLLNVALKPGGELILIAGYVSGDAARLLSHELEPLGARHVV